MEADEAPENRRKGKEKHCHVNHINVFLCLLFPHFYHHFRSDINFLNKFTLFKEISHILYYKYNLNLLKSFLVLTLDSPFVYDKKY